MDNVEKFLEVEEKALHNCQLEYDKPILQGKRAMIQIIRLQHEALKGFMAHEDIEVTDFAHAILAKTNRIAGEVME